MFKRSRNIVMPYLMAAVLLIASLGIATGGRTVVAASGDLPLVKPNGGLAISLEPQAAIATPSSAAQANLHISPAGNVATLNVSLAATGSARIDGSPTLALSALALRGAGQVPVRYTIGQNGAGEIWVTVTARDANGKRLITKRDVVYLLVTDGEVLQGTSGLLDLQLERLARDRAAGKLDAGAYQNAAEALLGAGAAESNSPLAGVAPVHPSSASTISIAGQILWTDRNGTTHPVRRAPVEIRDDELIGSDLVTTVSTDDNGNYSAVIDNDDGPLAGGRDVFVRVLASGPGFTIRNIFGDIQRIDSSIHNDLPDGTALNISLTANNSADNNTAFSLQSALVTANQYIEQVRGARFPDIPVVFPTNRVTSLFDGASLHILQLDRFDWDVMHHEYGHYVQSQLHIANSPGGSHNLNENLGETRGKDAGIRLAWGEGWPTYFGTSLQQVLGAAALGVPNVGDTHYQDTEDSSIDYDLEAQNSLSVGEDNEVSVQRILWDIYDSTNDGGDTNVSFGDTSVWNSIDAADPTTLSAAYQALIAGRSIREIAQIGCIVGAHRVAPSPTAPRDNGPATAAPPVFQWDANGGGPSNRNNIFNVEFYDASFTTLLFASPAQSSASFTPSQAQWDDITSRSGPSLNWLVKAQQTNSPATGTYTSCARQLNKADLSLVKVCTPADTVPLGVPFNCTITVRNLGPGIPEDVTVQDTLTTAVAPTNYTITTPTFSIDGSPAAACTVTISNQQFACALGNLPVGATAVIGVSITSDAAGLFTNQAQVSSGTIDPSPGDNQSSDSLTATPTSDLSIVKSAAPNPAIAGGRIVYALNVANAGPNPASQVRLVDLLPSDVTYVGANSACTQAPLGTITCDLSDLLTGESRTIELTVLTHATINGHSSNGTSITNTVVLTNQAGLDPNLSNNSAMATATIINNRVSNGLQVLYTFDEGSGSLIHDVAGVGAALDLQMADPAAVHWSEGGLVISATTQLASEGPAAKVSNAISTTGELTVEAWVAPADAHQNSLARIVTISNDPFLRNVELLQERDEGQDAAGYSVRLRTTDTNANGKPPLRTPKGSAKPILQHVVYTRDALGIARLYIDGIQRARDTSTGGFGNWDTSYRLILANVLTNDRPWLGEYQLVALYNRALSPAEVKQNFRVDPSSTIAVPAVGVQALYTFDENSGAIVHDRAGGGMPTDLSITNAAAVHWTIGGLAISAPTILTSGVAATRVISAVVDSNELTIEAWLASASPPQNRQSRILTIANDHAKRDVELIQERDSQQQTMRYSTRLRTTETSTSGSTSTRSPKQAANSSLQHVVYTRDAFGIVRLYIDGVKQADTTSNGTFSNWDHSYQLGLANSFAGDQPWLGEYQLVALYNRALSPAEVAQRYHGGPNTIE